MFRLIIFIAAILINLIAGTANTPAAKYYRENNLFNDKYQYPDKYNISLYIVQKIRHIFALKKCKKYLTKYDKVYTLKNKHITVIYDKKKMEIICLERGKNHRKTTVEWVKQSESMTDNPNNSFQKIFDIICYSFSDNTIYEGITEFLDLYFDIEVSHKKQEINDPAKKTIYIDEYIELRDKKQYTKPNKKIDINTANETELSKLPGINIITAKKIIKYRNQHSGFKSSEEFYKEMKIKPHFKSQMESIITVSNFVWKDSKQTDQERIIDI